MTPFLAPCWAFSSFECLCLASKYLISDPDHPIGEIRSHDQQAGAILILLLEANRPKIVIAAMGFDKGDTGLAPHRKHAVLSGVVVDVMLILAVLFFDRNRDLTIDPVVQHQEAGAITRALSEFGVGDL